MLVPANAPLDRALAGAATALAWTGGLVLLAAAALTVVSVLSRWIAAVPVPGDVELMQVACAIAVALMLPFAQVRRADVRVDFFTQRASRRTRDRLDAVGQALVALAMALLAWRAGLGVLEMRVAGETTMVLGWPNWLTYLAMVPGLALSAAVAARSAWRLAFVPDGQASGGQTPGADAPSGAGR